MKSFLSIVIAVLFGVLVSSCGDGADPATDAPMDAGRDLAPGDTFEPVDVDDIGDTVADVDDAGTVSDTAADSAPEIIITRPDGADGTPTIDVSTGDTDFEVPAGWEVTAAPDFGYLAPTSGPIAGGTLVGVWGANFAVDSDVRLAGTPVEDLDIVSPWELWFRTPPAAEGTATLKITTALGAAVAPDAFEYQSGLSVLSVTPSQALQRGGDWVVLGGNGFTDDTRIMIGEREVSGLVRRSTTEIEVQVPPADLPGIVDVIAFDTRFSRLRDSFRYDRRPELNRVIPDVVPAAGGVEVRLDGFGLDETCTLVVGGDEVALSRAPSGWLVAIAPASVPGAVDVSADCGARGASYLADGLRYVAAGGGRSVETVWPGTVFVDGGEVVFVSGSALVDADQVFIGGLEATILSASEYVLDVLTPPLGSGSYDLAVAWGPELISLPDALTYTAPVDFDAITPPAGATTGWSAAISGSGLAAVDSLFVDGAELEIAAQDEGEILVAVPAGTPGSAEVFAEIGALRVATGLEVSYLSDLGFSGFFPAEGATTGGSTVYVSGSGFTEQCTVLIDDVPTATDVIGSSLIAAVAPPHAEGAAQIRVECGTTSWHAPDGFMYVDPTVFPGGVDGGGIDGELRVTVREFGTFAPIEGATVMVQVRESSPFVEVTAADGNVTFSGDELSGPQTITAWAPERSAEAYVNVDAKNVTIMLQQLPPEPELCEPPDSPECQPAPETLAEISGFLEGLGKIIDFPPGTEPRAYVQTTRDSGGIQVPDAGDDHILDGDGSFRLLTRFGDMAIIALCGYEDINTGKFTALYMAVERGVQLLPSSPSWTTTLDCNIPLNQQLTIKLENAPPIVESDDPTAFPGEYRATVTLDFGGEGSFNQLPPVTGTTPTFTGGTFPALEGPLFDVTFNVEAGAYPASGSYPRSVSWVYDRSRMDRVISPPTLMPVPRFTVPAEQDGLLIDGYLEWELPPGDGPIPNLYSIRMWGSDAAFGAWNVYVPGHATSFNIADFPDDLQASGQAPGEPGAVMTVYLRALDLRNFTYDEFTRSSLSRGRTNSEAVYYGRFNLLVPEPPIAPGP